MDGKRVGVVVSGGIAAYKTCFLVRDLVNLGAEVEVVMTRNATEFVGPATFEALAGRPVITELFGKEASGRVEHVGSARAVDMVVIAPATANILAKMACGIADDAATTLLLATRAPILAAPAMNDGMWQNEATQENIAVLRRRGVLIIEPGVGFLAEGYEAVGRMAEPDRILESLLRLEV